MNKEVSTIKKFRNKVVGLTILGSAALANAAPADYLDSLQTNMSNAATKIDSTTTVMLGIAMGLIIFGLVLRVLKRTGKI